MSHYLLSVLFVLVQLRLFLFVNILLHRRDVIDAYNRGLSDAGLPDSRIPYDAGISVWILLDLRKWVYSQFFKELS